MANNLVQVGVEKVEAAIESGESIQPATNIVETIKAGGGADLNTALAATTAAPPSRGTAGAADSLRLPTPMLIASCVLMCFATLSGC